MPNQGSSLVLRSGLGASALGVGKVVAAAVAGQQMDVVGQAVEQGAGEALADEDLGPFVEGQVAGDQGGSALMALREDLEEEFRAGLGQRDEAEFIADQELDIGEALLVAQQALLVAGFDSPRWRSSSRHALIAKEKHTARSRPRAVCLLKVHSMVH